MAQHEPRGECTQTPARKNQNQQNSISPLAALQTHFLTFRWSARCAPYVDRELVRHGQLMEDVRKPTDKHNTEERQPISDRTVSVLSKNVVRHQHRQWNTSFGPTNQLMALQAKTHTLKNFPILCYLVYHLRYCSRKAVRLYECRTPKVRHAVFCLVFMCFVWRNLRHKPRRYHH